MNIEKKNKFGETIKSRNRIAQENEMLCKIVAYNITVLIREMIEMGADPGLLSLTSLRKELTLKPSDDYGTWRLESNGI